MHNYNFLYYIANILIHMVVYLFFVIQTFRNQLRFDLKIIILCTLLYMAAAAGIILVFFEYGAPFRNTVYSQMIFILFIVVTIFCCSILTKGGLYQTIFIILVTTNIQNSVIVMAKLITYLYKLDHFFSFRHLSYLLISVGILLLYCPVMWYIYLKLFKRVIDLNIQYSYWRLITLIPLMYLVYYRFSNYGGLPKDGIIYQSNLVAQILLQCTGLFSYIITLQMLLKTYESMKETEQLHVMEKYLEMQKIVYRNIRENSEKTARIQHDFRHHLLTIHGLAQKKDIDGLTAYLHNYIQECGMEEQPLCCHSAVDIILRYYAAIAKREGVCFKVTANIAEDIAIPDTDLCVVFGNLLENALRACTENKKEGGKRYITVFTEKKGEQLFISVENNFDGMVIEKNGRLLSTKKKPSGLGLSSVREIAEKAEGSMQIAFTDSVFRIQVHLNGRKLL